jgi:hypothetical protein
LLRAHGFAVTFFSPSQRDVNLLDHVQAPLHDDLFPMNRDDARVSLDPVGYRLIRPPINRHSLHLDIGDPDRFVDRVFLFVCHRPHAHGFR